MKLFPEDFFVRFVENLRVERETLFSFFAGVFEEQGLSCRQRAFTFHERMKRARSTSPGPSDGMADIRDLKSRGEKSPCGFDSRLGHPSFSSEIGPNSTQITQIRLPSSLSD